MWRPWIFVLIAPVLTTAQLLDVDRGGIFGGDITSGIFQNVQNAFDAYKYINFPLDERIEKTAGDIKEDEAVDYLERYGYETGDHRGLKGERLQMFMAPALKRFQRRMEIPETGELDAETKRQMAVPRCDFPDYITSTSDRQKRFVLGKSKWEASDFPLTVAFSDHSNKMGNREQEDAFMNAANAWAKVSGLQFNKGTPRNAKITIGFTRHDGPWGVLGKAWFPKVGKILFENGENWVPKLAANSNGLSFTSVAMHELGHALGISHSNVRNAIMHAQYQRDVLDLTNDDIKAAQKLYGSSGGRGRGGGRGRNPPSTKKPKKNKKKTTRRPKTTRKTRKRNNRKAARRG